MKLDNPSLLFFVPFYYLGIESRRFWYQKGPFKTVNLAGVQVISVGNLTVGGTGKTTVVQYLAQHFQENGKKVVIVGHGVGGKRGGIIVSDGQSILSRVQTTGDEAYLLAQKLPHIPVLSGRNRLRMAQKACALFGAEVIILDDAFHYLRLKKEKDILVFNAYRGLGNGHLLPAGPLREPLRNIKRANVLWFNHIDLVTPEGLAGLEKRLRQYNKTATAVKSYYRYRSFGNLSGQKIPLEKIAGKKVWVCTAIGEPQTFLLKLRRLNVEIVGQSLFPDHHHFQPAEIANLPLTEADYLVITEKDRVRFPPVVLSKPVIYPEIELVVEGLDSVDYSSH